MLCLLDTKDAPIEGSLKSSSGYVGFQDLVMTDTTAIYTVRLYLVFQFLLLVLGVPRYTFDCV